VEMNIVLRSLRFAILSTFIFFGSHYNVAYSQSVSVAERDDGQRTLEIAQRKKAIRALKGLKSFTALADYAAKVDVASKNNQPFPDLPSSNLINKGVTETLEVISSWTESIPSPNAFVYSDEIESIPTSQGDLEKSRHQLSSLTVRSVQAKSSLLQIQTDASLLVELNKVSEESSVNLRKFVTVLTKNYDAMNLDLTPYATPFGYPILDLQDNILPRMKKINDALGTKSKLYSQSFIDEGIKYNNYSNNLRTLLQEERIRLEKYQSERESKLNEFNLEADKFGLISKEIEEEHKSLKKEKRNIEQLYKSLESSQNSLKRQRSALESKASKLKKRALEL